MEKVRKISRKYYLRQVVACWMVCWMVFGTSVQIGMAEVVMTSNPVGDIDVTPLVGGIQDMTASHGAIGYFSDFDIALGHIVDCVQPDAMSQALFKVNGNGTQIYGTFTANGGIWLIDPAGILVGSGGAINVTNLVASSLNILDADFTNGLTTGIFQFSGGGLGDVINEGTIDAGVIALIGRNVINRGALVADEYVVMAAGDTVLITTDMVSNIVVEAAMAVPADHVVDQGGSLGEGSGTVEADHIILAAGDIWSTAIEGVETLRAEAKGNAVFKGHIDVYADEGSDAVADITIITAGDYTVNCDNEMTATAVGNGVDDATANITINAGGDVKIGEDSTEIFAYASEGYNNNASIEITAGGKVDVIAKESYVKIDAEAWDGTNNTADIKITANDGRVFVHGIDNEARIDADAWNGADNTANVEITAKGDDGDVKIIAVKGGEAEVRAEAWDADNQNTANIKINADGDVEVIAKGYGSGPPSEAEIYAEATNDDEKNTADITINAGGDVLVIGEESGYASILAEASWGFENIASVTITTEDGDVLVHGIDEHDDPGYALIAAIAEYAESKNSADVTITANGDDCVDCPNGDVKVIAVKGGKAEIEAIAMNSPDNDADVTIDAAGEVKVIANGWGSGPESEAEIMALAKNDIEIILPEDIDEDEVEGIANTANVDITGLNIEVKGEDRGEAEIEAIAKNDIFIDSEQSGEFNLTVQDIKNTAGVTLTANGDVTAEFDTGNVWVTATEGGKAKVGAEAENELYDQSNYTVNLTVEGPVENTADVTINADDDVEVTANLEGSRSVAEIEVKAENEISDEGDTVNLTVAGLVENTAGIDITAGDTVLVKAEDGGIASIEAKTENDTDINGEMEMIGSGYAANTANVKIDAEGSVKVIAEGYGSGPPSIAEIEAEAKYATDNTADITIDADCDVEVSGGVDDMRGEAGIEATAKYALNNNDADITINADNVKVIAGNAEQKYRGDAKIVAEAKYAVGEDEGSGNDADVTITADGDVLVHAGAGDETAAMRAEAEYGYENTANIGIVAGGNVEVIGGSAEYNHGGKAEMVAEAKHGYDNTADITINADGDVLVIGIRGEPEAKIYAQAEDADNSNTANIGIDAGGNVEVIAGYDEGRNGGNAEIAADAGDDDEENTATVTITAGGDVEVRAYENSEAEIAAEAVDGYNNTADVEINADNVRVIAEDGGEASIEAEAEDADNDNTATVTINADGDVEVIALGFGSGPPSEASIEAEATNDDEKNTAEITINAGGGVEVRAEDGGNAEVRAEAWDGITNDADVTINAGGDVKVIDTGGGFIAKTAKIQAVAKDGYTNTANVAIYNDGDVIVQATEGGEASIAAVTWDAYTNNSDVLICTDSVLVQGSAEMVENPFGTANIKAIAHNGENNNAYVGIGARGEDGVKVINYNAGHSSIAAKAFNICEPALSNDADVVICTNGGVEVRDEGGPGMVNITAEIIAEAKYGFENDAYVGVCADRDADGDGDVVVAASEDGSAMIRAEAEGPQREDSTANAEVVVVSHNGNVEVTGLSGGLAAIKAFAHNAFSNEASVGVSAENVGVLADGHGVGRPSVAGILALAMNGFENTADTVVCAPGEVIVVNAEGCIAGIGAIAVDGEENTATTQVYASEVEVIGEGAYIGSIAPPGAPQFVGDGFCLTEDGEVMWTDGGATLKIRDYGLRVDCPECPPCPCEELPFGEAAPLPDLQLPMISGCPVETQAAAGELGITPETIQVSIANALALSPDIQPCDACARLIDAARILSDEDGSLMAATIQAFTGLAPADAPFTPEMGASIAMTFEAAAAGTQYASVEQYIDAFVEYVTVLETELGAPVGDSTVFAMEKYGAGIAENANIVAYIEARLAGL